MVTTHLHITIELDFFFLESFNGFGSPFVFLAIMNRQTQHKKDKLNISMHNTHTRCEIRKEHKHNAMQRNIIEDKYYLRK